MDACLNLCASAELLHDLVQGIVSALEARDPHTAEHSLRVGDMVEQTCLAMGLPAEQVMTIHMAAHVHDIGKIAIDEKILNKPGRLTSEGDGSGCYFGMYSHGRSFDLYACTDEKFVFTSTFIAASIALISYALAVSVLLMVRDRSMRAMERQKKEQEESYQARCDSTKYC